MAERPGIVEHGLFLGMATEVVVAGENGIRILERSR
jgi:ribose 5-phosphate isomerase